MALDGAVIMVFKNTVTVEELDDDRVLRSARAEFPVPSVIRRRIYINIRRRREASSMKRLRIYTRDKYLFIDVFVDRDVRERVAREQAGRG